MLFVVLLVIIIIVYFYFVDYIIHQGIQLQNEEDQL